LGILRGLEGVDQFIDVPEGGIAGVEALRGKRLGEAGAGGGEIDIGKLPEVLPRERGGEGEGGGGRGGGRR